MKLPRRKVLQLAAGAAVLPMRFARAQAFPSRPVRFVVGFPAGGGADAATRIVAARLSGLWGQQVVVENKGGAGGNIAYEMVSHASPDGYTMLMGTNAVPLNQFLFSGLTFDPMSDLLGVSLIGTYPSLLVVPADAPTRTLAEFIVRARREHVTFATPGVGTSPHLAAELLKHMAKIDLTHIPYRGVAAGAMNDLLAGRLDAMFNTTGSLLQSVRVGQVRALAISSARRSPNALRLRPSRKRACRATRSNRGTRCSCRPGPRPRSSRRCRPTSPGRSTIPPCKRASSRSESRSQAQLRAAGGSHEGGSGAVGPHHQGRQYQG